MTGELKYPCVICGAREATSRDHVPPKGIFPKPLPTNLITVPACALCNNGASDLDVQFRVYLSIVIGDRHPEGTRLWKDHSLATLRKNHKLARTILEGAFKVPFFRPDGTFLGQKTAFRWPANAFDNVVERMARGLFWYHYKEILGARVKCEVAFLEHMTDEVVAATADYPQQDVGDGKFTWRYGRAEESPLNSLWLFEFYQAHWAAVTITPA